MVFFLNKVTKHTLLLIYLQGRLAGSLTTGGRLSGGPYQQPHVTTTIWAIYWCWNNAHWLFLLQYVVLNSLWKLGA